jgi:hypothetical protein
MLNGILFLYDNAAPHKVFITQLKLADLKHLTYSSGLAPLDYYVSPDLKKHLKGKKFARNEKATLTAEWWFAQKQNNFLGQV